MMMMICHLFLFLVIFIFATFEKVGVFFVEVLMAVPLDNIVLNVNIIDRPWGIHDLLSLHNNYLVRILHDLFFVKWLKLLN